MGKSDTNQSATVSFKAAALLYPGALVSSLALPKEIMQACGQILQLKARNSNLDAGAIRRGNHEIPVSFDLVGANTNLIDLGSGIKVKPDMTDSDLGRVDMLLLPAMWRNPMPQVAKSLWVLDRVTKAIEDGSIICSVGTGSYFLAEAGLLNGLAATTHWRYLDHFAKRYPDVDLKPRHLITQSGQIYCVSSVNSVADVMIHIATLQFGAEVANAVTTQFSPEIRKSFSAAAYQGDATSTHQDETILELQFWLDQNYGQDISQQTMMDKTGLTARSLNRRFKTCTNQTPTQYLNNIRMNQAKELLRSTNISIAEVSWRVGIDNASYFARLFREMTGVSARDYRKMTRGKFFLPPGQ